MILKNHFIQINPLPINNTTLYLSIHHNDKTIENYITELDRIFFKIHECEKQKLNIDYLLKTEICHTGFERLN